jgi:hypothetical protein
LSHGSRYAYPFQDSIEGVMVHHVKSIAEVHEEKVYVLVVEKSIFYGIDDVPNLPMGVLAGSETFLGGGDNTFRFCIDGKSPGQMTCPNFAQSVGHGNGPIVGKITHISFLVQEVSVALGPDNRCVSSLPQTAHEGME